MTTTPEHTDERARWEWETKYPPAARKCINREAAWLAFLLIALIFFSGVALCLSNQPFGIQLKAAHADAPELRISVDFHLIAVFALGCVGGTTFSIKWLIHSAAKGTWHLDRRYWRLLVPLLGGVYACVVLTLFSGGILSGNHGASVQSPGITSALAFLAGYFSDGVSGLLSNVANAVFGTIDKK